MLPETNVLQRLGRLLVCGLAAVALLVAAAAPAPAQGPKEQEGTAAGAIMGGILGGVIGGAVGGRAGSAIVGGIAGAAIGGLIGNRIGAALDEQDRQAMLRATRQAVVTGKSRRFTSKQTGVRGRAVVVGDQRVAGKQCRTIRQEVVLRDGRVVSDTVSACRGPNGWEV
jgi:surface antigen